MCRVMPVFVTAVALILFAGPAPAQQPVDYPHMRAALHELRDARKELHEARDTWPPGHKERAISAIDDAIQSLKTILAVRGEDFRGVERSPDYYNRFTDHPKLRAALSDLREAREELSRAKANFGTKKGRALDDIDIAVGHITALMRR